MSIVWANGDRQDGARPSCDICHQPVEAGDLDPYPLRTSPSTAVHRDCLLAEITAWELEKAAIGLRGDYTRITPSHSPSEES